MISPVLSDSDNNLFPNTRAVSRRWRTETANSRKTTTAAPGPKNTEATRPTTPQVDPQGTTYDMEIAAILCPQVSSTRAPVAPPIVQPKLTRNGITAFP